MDERILIWASPRDGRLTCEFLEHEGFTCCPCASWQELGREWPRGGAAIVIAAELLTSSSLSALEQFVAAQPRWSDPPLIIVGGDASETALDRFATLGNVSLLQRPLRLDTLRSTVQAALRARRRQYQVRDLLQQKEDAERRKDEFLAMLAHELRNPMAPLRTGLQLLQMRAGPETTAQTLQMMDRQISHLSRLVDDLLDVSRISRGRIPLTKAPLDIRDCVMMAVNAARGVASMKRLNLDVSLPPDPVIVDGDSVRLEQMIGNLLSNALKFTPERGGIVISVRAVDGQALVRISDTGIGIAVDQLAHVFELFAQSPRSLDRSLGGLGIGLTVVKMLAEQHGGRAEIFSPGEGAGTEAIIRLPLSAASPAAQVPEEEERPSVPRRVLVIEDNRDAADVLATYLMQLGHEVTVANDGRTGLERAMSARPDVIICDIGLPLIDGYEIASRLRREENFSGCLLIAMTGYGDATDRDRAKRAGFSHHLTKPADPRRVAKLVAAGADAA